MLRFLSFAFLFILHQGTLFSQIKGRIVSIENRADLLFLNKQYESAAERFLDALELLPESGNILHNIGYLYLHTDDKKHLAVEYLEKAVEKISPDYDPMQILEMNAPPDALYNLGRAYQAVNESEKAKDVYIRYLDYLDPNDDFVRVVEMRIASCMAVQDFVDNPIPVNFVNLGGSLNNEFSNINAVFSGDGSTMSYTIISDEGLQVWVSDKKDSLWQEPVNITEQLNNIYLKTTSISFHGTRLYFVQDINNQSLYYSDLKKGSWSKAKKLKKPVNSRFNESHASVSANDSVLYFTSDRPGGFGGLDIYRVSLDKKGRWKNPENLGEHINTEFSEDSPFVTQNGEYLFFSSEGHKSMGGYDVFYVNLRGEPEVINLGYPINNSDDNLFFFPGSSITSGFMSYHKPEGFGRKDIYKVEITRQINLIGSVTPGVENRNAFRDTPVQVAITNLDESNVVSNISRKMSDPAFSQYIIPGKYKVDISAEGFKNYTGEMNFPLDFADLSYSFQVRLVPEEGTEISQVVFAETSTVSTLIADTMDIELKRSDFTEVNTEKINRYYTVQFIALRNPVGIEKFSHISGSSVVVGNDGFTRYRVGLYNTIAEARPVRNDLRKRGYPDAFVRYYPISARYAIQIAASPHELEADVFDELGDAYVAEGPDGVYRYVYRFFDDMEHASQQLKRLQDLGYDEAFIRRIIPE